MATAAEPLDTAHNGRSVRTLPSARRRELLEETDRYLAELIEEVGEPSTDDIARADALWHRIESARAARSGE